MKKILVSIILFVVPIISFAQDFFKDNNNSFSEVDKTSGSEIGIFEGSQVGEPTMGEDANTIGAPIDDYWFLLVIAAVAVGVYFYWRQQRRLVRG